MSSTQHSTQGQLVLARSAWDEPSRVILAGLKGATALISSEDRRYSIGCPRSLIYEFNEELYGDLRAAANTNDRHTLAKLWSKADRLTDRE